MGSGEEEMVPMTPGSCGVGETMPRPPLHTEGYSLGYSMLQETVPEPSAQVWRMLPALVVGKDEAPSPTSLVAVGWQSRGGWKGSVEVCGVGAPRAGAGWKLKGSVAPEGIMNMGSLLPAPSPG